MKRGISFFVGIVAIGFSMVQVVYSADYLLGDFDYDGDVDGADLKIFSSVFGNTASCDSIYLNLCVTSDDCENAGGYWWSDNSCNSTPESTPEIGTVTSAGQVWMDRNLGASRVALSSTDTEAYGDLYQWGRGTDGHQLRTSATTSITSSTDDPGHGFFIIGNGIVYEWRLPANPDLWQGITGINNPCPPGFRLPTEIELDSEISSWEDENQGGAYDSPLRLPLAGHRNGEDGLLDATGTRGNYWSSTTWIYNIDLYGVHMNFDSDSAVTIIANPIDGLSVRCIQD